MSGPLGESGYKLPAGRILHLYGPRGEGKTGLAHVSLPGAVVIGREMDTRSVRVYQRALHVPLTRVYVPTWDPEQERVDLGIPADLVADVVIDSASDFERPRELVAEVARHLEATGRRGVCITWETEAGGPWGGSALGHLVWAVARVCVDPLGRRSCEILKNRSGPTAQISFLLPWDREAARVERCFYSVEGNRGRYRLAPWPHETSATRADVWRIGVEGAPEAPAAAAAKKLPGGGWSEPPDWRRRADYARSCGVPYFSPLSDDE